MTGFGAAQTQEQQPTAEPRSQPKLTFDVTRTHIALSGDVSSVAHESILRQRVATLFPQKTASFGLRQRPALPPGWALISEIALRAMLETYSSRTEITASGIRIRGITSNASSWRNELSRLEMHLLPGMSLEHEVSEIRSTGSVDRQCVNLIESAMRGRKIEFPRASALLGTVARPLLDELIQISADCPSARITITGHTDKTGDESGNLQLSQARADAVAAYMTAGGIAANRLTVEGAGSSRPLVAETSPRAAQQNRRIEIEMTFPKR